MASNLTGIASTPDQRTSIIIIAVCGLVSGIASFGLLAYLFWSAYGTRYNGPTNGFRSFLHTDAGKYLVSLLVADLWHALGYASGLHWLITGKVELGKACNFQGAFLELGDMGTVLWIFAISVHTLVHLFLSKRPPSWLSTLILICGWAIIILLPMIGPLAIAKNDRPFFDGGSGLWCWVSDSYPTTQILYFFVWAMVSLAVSIICYGLVFLRTAGYISGGKFAPAMERRGRSDKRRWACVSAFGHDSTDDGTESGSKGGSGGNNATRGHTIGKSVRQVARKLLLYPVAYAILVMPLTISSLGNMAGWNVPLGFLVASTCVYALGGLVDSVLFILTRRSFIRNATITSSRSRSRAARTGTAAPGEIHRLDGISVTRHELTTFDVPFDRSVGTVDKDQFESPITPSREKDEEDGVFSFANNKMAWNESAPRNV